MIRGVSWVLAICTATSSEPKVKTMKDSVAPTNTCSRLWTTAMSSCHPHCQCSRASIQVRSSMLASDTT